MLPVGGKSPFGQMYETTEISDMTEEELNNLYLMIIIGDILVFVAVFMAVSCQVSRGKVSGVELFFAIFFAPFYIIYQLLTKCK
jgi:hypothetical protein